VEETLRAADREEWRAWLERHHATESCVWLVFAKRATGIACVGYDEAVEEALCFGWIDGLIRGVDGSSHMRRFTPRKPGSRWSETNKARVRRAVENGRMTEAGAVVVRAAQATGEWDRALERESDVAPPDLAEALARNPKAEAGFLAFAPSHRKAYVRWVTDAKRSETRERRIREVVELSAQGVKPTM
jgi:uncharacterized protein YdeI (YjbR/CyaY-like superfamily)